MEYIAPKIIVFDSKVLAKITADADSGITCIGQCAGVCNVARSGISECNASCGANKTLKTGPCGFSASDPAPCNCSSNHSPCSSNK